MVRGRRTNNPRGRGRRSVRPQMRQIFRALSFEPRRIALPADPPSLLRTFHYNTTLQIYIKTGSETKFDPGSVLLEPSITVKDNSKSYDPCTVTVKDLFAAWCNWTGFALGKDAFFHADLALLKLAYWGPSTNTFTGACIGATVDIPAPGSSYAVTDVGTTTSRARAGITIPQRIWTSRASDHTMLRVDVDSEVTLFALNGGQKLAIGSLLGTVQVTLAVRFVKNV